MVEFLTDKKLESIETLKCMVLVECEKQINKWGVQTRTPFEWMTYLTEEVGELAEAISEEYYRGKSKDDIVKEAIQVATLALKIAEMYETKVSEKIFKNDTDKEIFVSSGDHVCHSGEQYFATKNAHVTVEKGGTAWFGKGATGTINGGSAVFLKGGHGVVNNGMAWFFDIDPDVVFRKISGGKTQ